MSRRLGLLACLALFIGVALHVILRLLDERAMFGATHWALLALGATLGAAVAFGLTGTLADSIRFHWLRRWALLIYWILGAGAYASFLYLPPPLAIWAFASGLIGALALGTVPLFLGPPTGLRRLPPEEHIADVLDVRPTKGDSSFEPYVVARCECGWVGPVRKSLETALEDASGHTPFVKSQTERPLG